MRDKLRREVRAIAEDAIYRQFRRQATDRNLWFSGTDRYIEQVIDARIARALIGPLRNQTATEAAAAEHGRQIVDIEAALNVVGPGEARARLEVALAKLVLDG